jgi:hypothetical protein
VDLVDCKRGDVRSGSDPWSLGLLLEVEDIDGVIFPEEELVDILLEVQALDLAVLLVQLLENGLLACDPLGEDELNSIPIVSGHC